MTYNVALDPAAERELDTLDPQISRRILRFLNERVAHASNPRLLGAALRGSLLGDLWKFRVGDYRVIADIQDARLTVLVVRIDIVARSIVDSLACAG